MPMDKLSPYVQFSQEYSGILRIACESSFKLVPLCAAHKQLTYKPPCMLYTGVLNGRRARRSHHSLMPLVLHAAASKSGQDPSQAPPSFDLGEGWGVKVAPTAPSGSASTVGDWEVDVKAASAPAASKKAKAVKAKAGKRAQQQVDASAIQGVWLLAHCAL
eukprot:1160006-Pelagomonas_calceolata.AAC.11